MVVASTCRVNTPYLKGYLQLISVGGIIQPSTRCNKLARGARTKTQESCVGQRAKTDDQERGTSQQNIRIIKPWFSCRTGT